MAVYTKIEKNLLINFLCHYKIGELINFEGIQEGVENSNYKIVTTLGTFILTIFEKRVKANDLPFFIELTKHLVKKNFKCPKPIPDKNGKLRKEEHTFCPGDCCVQPPEIVHNELKCSDDLELLEITSPAKYKTAAI